MTVLMDNETRAALIAGLGIEYKAVFVPQSASRNSGEENPSLNWRVTLRRVRPGYLKGSPIVEIISTDYMQGIGHLPPVRTPKGSRYWLRSLAELRSLADQREREAAETGKAGAFYSDTFGTWCEVKPLPEPALADVLYSLLLHGSAAEMSFDSWCSDYGYDTDSRKALATYEACRDIGHQLQRMFTAAELSELREAFQDY